MPYLSRTLLVASLLYINSASSVWAAPGDLDLTFNGTGTVTTSIGSRNDGANSVIRQADGKLVAAGHSNNGSDMDFALVRYNSDGSLDTSFGGTGKVTTAVSTAANGMGNDEALSVIQQADGKLVAAGRSYNSGDYFEIALLRYNSDGSLDTSFGGDGIVTIGVSCSAHSVIQQADGKLVVAGDIGNEVALLRYNSDGSLDTSFDGDGIVTTSVTGYTRQGASSVIQQADGKLLAAGSSNNGSDDDFLLVRYNGDGSLDTSFDGDGIVTADITGGSNDSAFSVIQQADGKLVAAGNSYHNGYDGSGMDFALLRYNGNGSLDATFDSDGIVTTAVGIFDRALSVIQQVDGKLVAVGYSMFPGSNFELVRYNSNGSLDTSFGGDGIVTTGISGSSNDNAYSVIQQDDGKLVVAGSSVIGGNTVFAVARYDSGQLGTDNDYNNDGIAGWIWKGQSNGVETQTQVWQLSFPLYSTNFATPARTFPPVFADQANWDIVTSGDFNRDGDADILWRNKTTDAWKIWQMQNGLRVAQTNWNDVFDPSREWVVVGAGDTDKDGDDDIILNNTTTGAVMIWQMQNYVVSATHTIGTKAGYTLNRIGDFNKDGDVDLLFRQNAADVLITWELEANAVVTERALANTGTGYSPVCVGDFDKDGDDDIMLVNSSTKQEKWFVMENYTRTQQFGGINDGFVLLGCGDYDGDGDADSLWQRSTDDMNRIVLQQNWGATKQTVYTNPFGGVNGFVYRGNNN